ncbi:MULTISPECIES: ogr/Delta-like zinc finger family protein [unclassified Vibrio]|uniref:ogr/Delta-like zinc finger family protein n=1 Tax=unclassified Vibrio TaxID=2614977 RepID=UPI001360B7AA|nr:MULTISPECIES: ogr/Delta-like zinc finger family protein [unclassified Vibrio]NAW58747.1 zinc-binding protein [Vibrio sp. V36_P2S2PM302]NAX27180.1 zinc-binding protein [Vibrio sp. V38_P2S17PM301]NAX31733.1 zinc-binding protein [Vibrio sp. V37_P2S8PM304]
MPCPTCGCKSRVVTSQAMSDNTRKRYRQCLNYNCAERFHTLETVSGIVTTVGVPPDPKLQPELCKGDFNQIDIFSVEQLSE